MKRKRVNHSGFTLAELLIVVAIIGVLVAIAIPIFTSQLERSREATDAANIRSHYAVVMAETLSTGQSVNGSELVGPVQLKQQKDGWSSESTRENLESVYGTHIVGTGPVAGGTAWVEFNADEGYPILHYEGAGSGGGTSGGDDPGTGGGDDPGSGIPAGAPDFVTGPPTDWNDAMEAGRAGQSYSITVGKVYYWNDSYYIGIRADTLDHDNLTSGTPDTFTGWYTLAKFTETIHDISEYPSDTNVMQQVERGDVCKVGDDYYVFSDGGNTTYGPVREPGRWTKINS
jgi:prepilin-type N-terminal cleavage/methylation domain-containing protein